MVNRTTRFSRFARVTSGGAYLPAVDGLRFLAITGVIFHHAVGYWTDRAGRTYTMTPFARCVAELIEFGAYGVHLFFVLSGFILALPFCKAARGGTSVDLGKYFWRREWFGFFTGDVLLVCFATYPIVVAVGPFAYLLVEKPCVALDWPTRLRGWLGGKGAGHD